MSNSLKASFFEKLMSRAKPKKEQRLGPGATLFDNDMDVSADLNDKVKVAKEILWRSTRKLDANF